MPLVPPITAPIPPGGPLRGAVRGGVRAGAAVGRRVAGRVHFVPITDDPEPDWLQNVTAVYFDDDAHPDAD
jgi:hypothetical protein